MARDCYDDCIAFLDDQLGRLLDELRAQGLLDNTVVIITSDHGEAFGDHGVFGHSNSRLPRRGRRPAGDPRPGARRRAGWWAPGQPARPAGDRGRPGWASRPAPRSRAARWRPTGRLAPGPGPRGSPRRPSRSSPSPAAFQPQACDGPGPHGGFQMSLLASGRHYIRDGTGAERLYDLAGDPFERVNLMDSPEGRRAVGAFRRMLLEVLTENPGSAEVENAYLESYRQGLKALVPGTDATLAKTAAE